MAPAEVYVEGKYRKVHAGDTRQFRTKKMDVEVDCSLFDTTVEFSGQDLNFIVQNDEHPISTQGRSVSGRVRTYLGGEGDSIEITDKLQLERIKVTHTKHDGSTGEVG